MAVEGHRRKGKYEHLKTTHCLSIIFAQLSEGKILMVGHLSLLCTFKVQFATPYQMDSESTRFYLLTSLFIFFRIICQVVNQHKISRERKKRSH